MSSLSRQSVPLEQTLAGLKTVKILSAFGFGHICVVEFHFFQDRNRNRFFHINRTRYLPLETGQPQGFSCPGDLFFSFDFETDFDFDDPEKNCTKKYF